MIRPLALALILLLAAPAHADCRVLFFGDSITKLGDAGNTDFGKLYMNANRPSCAFCRGGVNGRTTNGGLADINLTISYCSGFGAYAVTEGFLLLGTNDWNSHTVAETVDNLLAIKAIMETRGLLTHVLLPLPDIAIPARNSWLRDVGNALILEGIEPVDVRDVFTRIPFVATEGVHPDLATRQAIAAELGVLVP